MSDTSQSTGTANIQVSLPPTRGKLDLATILGFLIATGLVVAALLIGGSPLAFVNAPAMLIVLGGTLAVTSMSYNSAELSQGWGILRQSLVKKTRDPSKLAVSIMDLAAGARKHGLLALAQTESTIKRDPFLHKAVQMVTDGYTADDIEWTLNQEIERLIERHRRGASIMKRAAEVAPAMGLIGTLVGLVQMLTKLSDPASIGPSMAIALLTTFYGAILGTVVFAPLAAKLEKNSADETLLKSIIMAGITSIARQENPRRTEMLLNSELPPSDRIRYFK